MMFDRSIRTYAAALAIAAAFAAAPAHAATLHSNLIDNGDAEQGAVSASEGDTSESIAGWSVVAGHMVILAHEDKFGAPDLDPDPANPFEPGDNFFYGGQTSTPSVLAQSIDVSPLAGAIDSGATDFVLSGWLGGWSTHDDRLDLVAVFRDGGGNALGEASIGPVWAADRNAVTGFLFRSDEGAVPELTRTVQLTMSTYAWQGASNNDGMADNLSLVFVPEPGTIALLGTAGLLAIARRPRRSR